MHSQCTLEQQSAQPTLSVRFRSSVADLTPHFERIYGAIGRYLEELGEQPAGPPFATYDNMDMDEVDVEAGFPVRSKLPAREDIEPHELPAGSVATCVQTGSYQDVESGYTALMEFIQTRGLVLAGAPYEFYLSDPSKTPSEKTKILLPVKKV